MTHQPQPDLDVSPEVDELIERLELQPHPEGGYFRETWRSPLELPADALPARYDGAREAGTSILYLLPEDGVSARHRVASDELWLYQCGDPLELTVEPPGGETPDTTILGQQPGQRFQSLVPANHWQTATSCGGPAGYTLVGCVVVPGFDFEDFEMG